MDGPEHSSRRIQISLTQLLAGSAAAVCGAWLASTIGVAGTLVGAGLVSAFVTVLSAVYAHGARRAAQRLLVKRAELLRGRAPASYAEEVPPAAGTVAAGGHPATDADGHDALSTTQALLLPPFDLEGEHGYRWGRIALAALAVFLVGMLVVTVVEVLVGHSLTCSTTGSDCERTTTVPLPGATRHSHTPTPTPAVSTRSVSATPTPTATPTVSDSTSPSPSATTSGSGTPTASVSPTATSVPTG